MRQLPSGFSSRFTSILVLLVLATGYPRSSCSAEPIDIPHVRGILSDALDPLLAGYPGRVAVLVRHIPSGVEYAHHADEVMPTASLIKLPVMLAAYDRAREGQLVLRKQITYRLEDRVPGSGILSQHFSPGMTLSLRDAVRLMMAYSDNTATNLVLKELGLTAVNEFCSRHTCPHTRIHSLVYRPDTSIDPEGSQKCGLGQTTAREMVSLLVQIAEGTLGTPEDRQEILEHLLSCDDKTRINRHLPEKTVVRMKTGSVTAVRTVAGLIETPGGQIAICVLTADNKDRRWSDDNAAYILSQDVARVAWETFGSQTIAPPDSVDSGRLKIGSQGSLVEDLQRTLQVRLQGSPSVAIDGEFGPQTAEALRQFQKSAGIPETGETDATTWEALGVLVSADAALKATQDDPLLPPYTLEGPPAVTCRSWVIGNPHDGAIFGSHDSESPRDFASTTKIMSAYVVLLAAEQAPEIMQELVTISPRADATPGSSAGVRAGEQIPVEDLLYGLMLPSGNDAAVALAEHYGMKFTPNDTEPPRDPLTVFVDRMNQVAVDSEMKQTRYTNPHGLTDEAHQSTAVDQFRLVTRALRIPQFREIVGCRRHSVVLNGPGGYRREVAWTNTNRFLRQEGFAGVKTGTTSAAGACLISLEKRGEREVVAVVLGSSSSECRYLDSQNLLRWYWLEMEHVQK